MTNHQHPADQPTPPKLHIVGAESPIADPDNVTEIPTPSQLLGMDGKPVELTEEGVRKLMADIDALPPEENLPDRTYSMVMGMMFEVGGITGADAETGEEVQAPAIVLDMIYMCGSCDETHNDLFVIPMLPEVATLFDQMAAATRELTDTTEGDSAAESGENNSH